MDNLILPLTTNHYFPNGAPTDRRSSRVTTGTVVCVVTVTALFLGRTMQEVLYVEEDEVKVGHSPH